MQNGTYGWKKRRGWFPRRPNHVAASGEKLGECCPYSVRNISQSLTGLWRSIPDQETNPKQGGHGTGKTGKTGNLVLTFSTQGKHREFCFDTGKNSETQGKYFCVTQGKYLTVTIKIKSMFIFLNFKIF